MKKKNRSRRLQNMNTNMPDRWPMNMIHMNTNTPDDRLSALPDDVISHILSFLPTTKTSIQTSVLAKGWRRLWTRVTSLDLTIENPADWKIVDEVIMLRHKGQIIHTFRLHSCYDSELIEPWIETVVERKVQTLFIHLVNDQFIWPSCLSASQTLVDLSLLNCSGTIPTTINFPALKKLLLKLNEFECKNPDESLPRLLSGCPVLEDLEIQMLFCSKNIELCSPTLTRLSVGYDHQWDVCWLLKLDTPALRHLHLRSDHDSEVFSAGTLTSVTHAQVDCCVHNCVESDIHDDVERSKLTSCSRNFLEFVGKLYNVERLKLRCPLIVPYPTFSAFLAPKFRNLTELNLSVGLCFLKCFLENADNLRLLTISDSDTGHWTEPEYWEEPEQVPSCLISSLETVNLVDFALVNSREFDVARYILKNGKVLKRMAISTRANRFYHHPDSINYKEEFKAAKKGKFKALKRLALFERGSNACQLAFELVDLTLTTLTEADVLISVYTIAWIYSDRDDDGEIDIERKVAYSRSVGKLCNVKCLKLTSPLIVPHSTFSPKFHNSTQLNLCDYICYGFLKSFLKLMRALIAFDSL